MQTLDQHLASRLGELEAAGLLREPKTYAGVQSAWVQVEGRRALNLCSNNYLGLAEHPALCEALVEALATHGAGAGASRLVCGTSELHVIAERVLAAYLGLPAARLFSTGYAGNVGTLQALLTSDDIVFSDELNHASLIDGCRISGAKKVIYRHAEPNDVERKLAAERGAGRHALIVTDAVFSMDGDFAPLRELRALADRYDAWLMVDEAHSVGVLGERGRGLSHLLGVRPDVYVGTLGKAFGLQGAFVAGSSELTRYLENRARSYVFSTAPSPAFAAAIPRAIELIEKADDRRATLTRHARRLGELLGVAPHASHEELPPRYILPHVVGDANATMHLSNQLFTRGLFIQGIRPPTVPAGTSRLRIVPTAAHSDDDIELAARELGRALGLT